MRLKYVCIAYMISPAMEWFNLSLNDHDLLEVVDDIGGSLSTQLRVTHTKWKRCESMSVSYEEVDGDANA